MTTDSIATPPVPFKYEAKAHPTTYGGITFRSRLEATWAVFFDNVKLNWQYEPIDLPGWMPDFILEEKVAVEVKPVWSLDEMPAEIEKMKRSGWPGPLVILGTQPRCYRRDDDKLGWCLNQTSFSGQQLGPTLRRWFSCYDQGTDLFWSYESDGGMGAVQEFLDDAWAAAFKTTQYKAPKA